MTWPADIRIEAEPQFPMSRFAADVPLVDRPESTLEWALSWGAPLIFLNHRFTPAVPQAVQGIGRAVFSGQYLASGVVKLLA
jgi:hypothetical protein